MNVCWFGPIFFFFSVTENLNGKQLSTSVFSLYVCTFSVAAYASVYVLA